MLTYMDKQMADMAAMRRAIVCCNGDFDDIILGQYTPLGPAGGVYGGTVDAEHARVRNGLSYH